jgi:hypothetical protein
VRVPDSLLKCVGFISHENSKPEYFGTFFVVGVPGKHGNTFPHAITAKHVAEHVDAGPFFFGVNFKDDQAGWLRSDIKWWYHPTDPNLDVAVTVMAASDRTDMEYVPEAIFATEEIIKRYNIGLGDEISVVGLFSNFVGTSKHFPMVRTGNIAMMPTDKVPMEDGPMEVYLAEGRSIGGLSGSPVFVRPTTRIVGLGNEQGPQTVFGVGGFHFLGLMRGHWDLPLGVNVGHAEAVNMGISIVVPAKKILETLYHPELVALRDEQDDRLKQARGSNR